MGSLSVAQHFQFLLKTMKANRCLEIGSKMGFITLSIAMSLPDDGEVISLEACSANDQIRSIWKESGHGHKVFYFWFRNFCVICYNFTINFNFFFSKLMRLN